MLELLIIVYAVLAFIPAAIAHNKGRSWFGWLIYGLLLFPVAFLHALLATPDQAVVDARRVAMGAGRRCPHCAEVILPAAKVCRYCGRDVVAEPPRETTGETAAAASPSMAGGELIEGPQGGGGGLDPKTWAVLAGLVGIAGVVALAVIVAQQSAGPAPRPAAASWETSPERSLALVGCARGLETGGKARGWIAGARLDEGQAARPTGSVDMMREVVCDFRTQGGELGQVAVLLACDDAKNPACTPVHWVRAGEREWRAAR